MKKHLCVTILLFLLVLISGCVDKNVVNTAKQTNAPLTINDYFPFKENTKYDYEGRGNEYASYNVFVDYLTGNRIQLRSNNGGSETVKVLENKDGILTILLTKGECYYREDFTQKPNSNGEILLKEPLKIGTKWNISDDKKRYISNVGVKINTPLGNYETLEVTTSAKDYKTLHYYAQNIGLVKTVFVLEADEITSALSGIEKNIPLTQMVKFYYPNVNEDKLYSTYKKLTFYTNDATKDIFEKAFKNLPKENLGAVLGPNVKINSLYLNKDNIVYVDFPKEFLSEMNAGSGYEGMILQSITNTLGEYYGVDKVIITIEGNPYSSGHFMMEKGEYFKVDTNNSLELK